MAPIGRGLCVSYLAAGEFRKTPDVAPMIIDLLEKTHRESDFFDAPFNTYSLLCSYYGLSLAMLGNFEKGTAYIERGLRAILEISHLASLGVAEAMYGMLFIAKGDGASAIEHFQKSIRYFEEGKTVLIFSVIWTGLGSGYYYLGDFEPARKHIEKGLDITIQGGSEWWSSFHYLYLSKTHFELGDQKTSRNFIEDALKLSQKKSEKHFEGASWTWLGRILGKTDPSKSDKAEECILKGISILDEMKIKPWRSEGHFYLGELYADIGKREKALENLNKAEGHFKEMGMDYWLAKTQKVLGRL
jgi:tetratricopeptide (TPR) repeat protein